MYDTIIVAGLGRCGTTLVFDSLSQIYKSCGFLIDIPNKFLRGNAVYKTHSYPNNIQNKNSLLIFMYGNPYDIVKSVHCTKGLNKHMHYKHLKSKFNNVTRWKFEDTLNLEKLFDTWVDFVESGKNINDVLFIRYESLYENINKLNDILNLSLNLPPWRERMFSGVDDLDINKTYKNLYDKITNSPDIKLYRNDNL